MSDQDSITTLLNRWNSGDKSCGDQVIALLQPELRRLATYHLRGERSGHTLQPTALLNELFIRLISKQDLSWNNRSHFFGFAARTFRHILIDYARERRALRRGGELRRVTLALDQPSGSYSLDDLLIVDEGLQALQRADHRAARVVELRFFGGLQESEIADVIGVSEITVKRDWKFARAWLMAYFTSGGSETSPPVGL